MKDPERNSDGTPTEFGRLYTTTMWLRIARTALEKWIGDDLERKADLGWLAEGLEVAAGHLLELTARQLKADPHVEIVEGQHPRH